ncbi:MAG: hypothetical protein JXA71_15620 [Chitinispirillaceae bacterium]|nr:hypothetical protein [Chitinispirillaceae bacterium]
MSLFRRMLIGLLTAGTLCLLAVCQKENPVGPTVPVATELEGSWSGMNKDGIDQTFWTYTMKLDSIIIDADGVVRYRGTFTVDTTAAPRHIDLRIIDAREALPTVTTIPGLYNLSGNILEITANAPGSPRPASMDAAPVISLINNN